MTDRLYATLLQADAVLSRPKAKMPDLTVAIRKAQSADEVADLINSAWLTYGAGEVKDASFDLENEFDTFDDAMKYLWFKPQEVEGNAGSSVTYAMRGIPYEVVADDDNGIIHITVREV